MNKGKSLAQERDVNVLNTLNMRNSSKPFPEVTECSTEHLFLGVHVNRSNSSIDRDVEVSSYILVRFTAPVTEPCATVFLFPRSEQIGLFIADNFVMPVDVVEVQHTFSTRLIFEVDEVIPRTKFSQFKRISSVFGYLAYTVVRNNLESFSSCFVYSFSREPVNEAMRNIHVPLNQCLVVVGIESYTSCRYLDYRFIDTLQAHHLGYTVNLDLTLFIGFRYRYRDSMLLVVSVFKGCRINSQPVQIINNVLLFEFGKEHALLVERGYDGCNILLEVGIEIRPAQVIRGRLGCFLAQCSRCS